LELQGDDGMGRWPPWSRIPSLQEMTRELGIDFDEFIAMLRETDDAGTLAGRFGISEELAGNLVEHFYRYGASSVMEGD